MSASFSIASSTGAYDVSVAPGSLAATLAALEDAQLLADEFFRPHLQGLAREPLFLPATEAEKSLDHIPALIDQMRRSGANRRTRLVAIGGGVIQDIAAFVASIYMRGLEWSYIPTTVLAMVDSCIGGKSSINVGPFKNLVGTFHPPQRISIDPILAQSLPADQFASGLIEAAKICFCRGPESFSRYLAHVPSPFMPPEALEQVIRESLLSKKHFIEIDEFDQKERLLLNFGHTFGHAIEGASHYGIPHGIAVGVGILCSLAFQRQRGVQFQTGSGVEALENQLRTLTSVLADLPAQLASLNLTEVMDRFASDKKHATGSFTVILVSATGQVVLERLPRTPQLETDLQHAIQTTLESYT
jgi:3-dehydroquinate synthase